MHQLETAITNNDKKLFINTIYDLPADVIVGFTIEELSQFMNLSSKIDLNDVNELFDFLANEGTLFFEYAFERNDELNNSFLGRFYYSLCISLYENNTEKVKKIFFIYSTACCLLAEMGIDKKANLEKAVGLCEDVRKTFPKTSAEYARALLNEGVSRSRLAEIGIDSRENIEMAIRLYTNVRDTLPRTNENYAEALIYECATRGILAQMGVDSRYNLEKAINLCCVAREMLPKTSENYAKALDHESISRQLLAQMGIDRRENLETAISLCCVAQKIFPKISEDYAKALDNEGTARVMLADMSIDSKENLEKAVSLYSVAQEIHLKTSEDYAKALSNEGTARQKLAQMGIDSRDNLDTSVRLYIAAREILHKTSADYALALMNEGCSRLTLADMGIDSRVNLETVIRLCCIAREILPKTSGYYAYALLNEGASRSRLVEMDINRHENFKRSKKMYMESIQILEKLGDGWAYSIVLLSFNRLLKDNFYRTGDRKYLYEWKSDLGNIEEKIKNRDIRDKELIMARIHEIRANLREFEGKSGISDASFEYYEAYKISKEPFYKFMMEFCQAKNDDKSFCKLVDDWKEAKKEGIFLDHYDYIVFECHLENALKKSIFRKDELELARQKLEEIGNRTQIKIIKNRVSAYVFLMNSLDFCFEQGLYEDAAENVRKACKIFHEFDDKQGCEMCESFHEALENRNAESWRNVVQKIILSGEFSSNFYRLLCNYADRKRTNILENLPVKILEKTSIIEAKIDNVQKTLDKISSECTSIKDQIEEGFDGTAKELREIKGEVNKIEKNLETLVQSSKDVDGKEGECIRQFAAKMLELMKKGDYEALKHFVEKINENEASLKEIIEKSEAPEQEKADAKSRLADLIKIPGVLKEKAKSFGKDVAKDVVVTLTAEEIVKLLVPVLSTAVFGVPIPSKIVEILFSAIRNL